MVDEVTTDAPAQATNLEAATQTDSPPEETNPEPVDWETRFNEQAEQLKKTDGDLKSAQGLLKSRGNINDRIDNIERLVRGSVAAQLATVPERDREVFASAAKAEEAKAASGQALKNVVGKATKLMTASDGETAMISEVDQEALQGRLEKIVEGGADTASMADWLIDVAAARNEADDQRAAVAAKEQVRVEAEKAKTERANSEEQGDFDLDVAGSGGAASLGDTAFVTRYGSLNHTPTAADHKRFQELSVAGKV